VASIDATKAARLPAGADDHPEHVAYNEAVADIVDRLAELPLPPCPATLPDKET
jgi:hypothetical protein